VVHDIDFKPFGIHRCVFESWILSYEVAIQLAYGLLVVILGYQSVPGIMHGSALEVFLHQ
jgi:hypothetical protein